MNFELHPNLLKKIFIVDLPLCKVLLEDNQHYPWLILVPRRSDVSRIMDLNSQDQLLLLQELDLTQKILWNHSSPDQLNVAALGNKTPQLHIHVIARMNSDPAWPGVVWDHPSKLSYTPDQKEHTCTSLRLAFQNYKLALHKI